jgi:hypothetical protein
VLWWGKTHQFEEIREKIERVGTLEMTIGGRQAEMRLARRTDGTGGEQDEEGEKEGEKTAREENEEEREEEERVRERRKEGKRGRQQPAVNQSMNGNRG